jgi:acetyl esterase/lipase
MMRIKSSILPMLLLSVCFITTGRAQAKLDIFPDAVYGHKDGMALTMDVIKPKVGANGAAVIFVVSGGYISNYSPPEQLAERDLFKELLNKGFTLIALRHGGSPKYLVPEIVADVRRGVRYVRFNARKWGVDPNRLGIFGGSAGGHLSLMIGTASDNGDPKAAEEFMRESDRVAAVVAWFPPVDMRPLARGLGAPNDGSILSKFPALNFEKEKAADYSPIVFVTPDDPPTLLIHGDKDTLVPISNSQIIYDAFQKNRVRSDFVTMEGADHGFQKEAATRSNALTVGWFEQILVKDTGKPKGN